MTTTQIVVIVVALLIAVVVIALLVRSMKARSRADNSARAEQLRRQADERAAAVLPDSQVRAERAEAEAEQARRAAEVAQERAAEAKVEVAQTEAVHEDQVRAADRLDPAVDHRADDYAPQSTRGQGSTTGATTGAAAGATTGATTSAAAHDGPDTILDDDGHADGDHTGAGHGDAGRTEADDTGASRTEADEAAEDQVAVEQADEQPTAAEQPAAQPAEDELDADGGTPGRPPLGSLPRRTPGAQEMPGRPLQDEGGGSLFKRRDDSSGS